MSHVFYQVFSCTTAKMAIVDEGTASNELFPFWNVDFALITVECISQVPQNVVLGQDPTQRELCALLGFIYGL